MVVLSIVTGAETPILRQKTVRVPRVTKAVLQLIEDMQQTVIHANGVGLAAPQVGSNLRLCLAKLHSKMTPLINPFILWQSAECDVYEEGCLSLPGIDVSVSRPTAITLQYTDLKGTLQERRLAGFDARVVQHEIDHLEGRLIVDYLPANRKSPSVNAVL